MLDKAKIILSLLTLRGRLVKAKRETSQAIGTINGLVSDLNGEREDTDTEDNAPE